MKAEFKPHYKLELTGHELKLVVLSLLGRLKEKEHIEEAARLSMAMMTVAMKCVDEQKFSIEKSYRQTKEVFDILPPREES